MPKYYLDQGQRRAYDRRQTIKRLIVGLLLLILLIAGLFGIFVWQGSNTKAGPIVVKPPTKSYYAGAPKRVFQTERFSFTSTSNWQISQEESLGDIKYVFFTHSLTNNLVEYEFDVYFDRGLQGKPVNYVLPVTVADNSLKPGGLSPRCGDDLVAQKGNAAPNTMAMQYQGASYTCAVKGSGEAAAASVVGGNYDINLKTPAGNPTVVNLGFVNNSSSNFSTTFSEVVRSFKLK